MLLPAGQADELLLLLCPGVLRASGRRPDNRHPSGTRRNFGYEQELIYGARFLIDLFPSSLLKS